ncbi:hypothetical protein JCM9533A_01880 [Catenuloplanes niger JCM 9533]
MTERPDRPVRVGRLERGEQALRADEQPDGQLAGLVRDLGGERVERQPARHAGGDHGLGPAVGGADVAGERAEVPAGAGGHGGGRVGVRDEIDEAADGAAQADRCSA